MPIDENADTIPAPPYVPGYYTTALAELGVQEVSGKGANPRIVEYLKSCPSLPAAMAKTDETAWCSAFANWCMAKARYKGTNSALARSWLSWGHPLDEPREGCIVVFASPARGPQAGHVGMYSKQSRTPYAKALQYHVLGGNQSNRVCVAPYSATQVIALRWPAE